MGLQKGYQKTSHIDWFPVVVMQLATNWLAYNYTYIYIYIYLSVYILLTVLGARSLKSRCFLEGMVSIEALGGPPFLSLPASVTVDGQHPWVCGCITPLSASIFAWSFLLFFAS